MTLLWSTEQANDIWESTPSFIDKLNKERHLGQKDWRLPKLWELHRAFEDGHPGFRKAWYPADTKINHPCSCWGVDFNYGSLNSIICDPNGGNYFIRCVSEPTKT